MTTLLFCFYLHGHYANSDKRNVSFFSHEKLAPRRKKSSSVFIEMCSIRSWGVLFNAHWWSPVQCDSGLGVRRDPWRQSDINSEAYLVQGRDHVRKFQKKAMLLPAPFLLGRDLPSKGKPGQKELLKKWIQSHARSRSGVFFSCLTVTLGGMVSPLNPH